MDEDIGYNFKIMWNKREDRSLYLAYSKKFYLLLSSNHLEDIGNFDLLELL